MALWAAKLKPLSWASASARICVSTVLRRVFSASRVAASAWARAGSVSMTSASERWAEPSLPPAFSRGANWKAMDVAVTGLSASPAASISAATPGLGPALMASRPNLTMTRFSPVSGTTSATVASAATSTQGIAAPWPPRAHTSFHATPAPQSDGKG